MALLVTSTKNKKHLINNNRRLTQRKPVASSCARRNVSLVQLFTGKGQSFTIGASSSGPSLGVVGSTTSSFPMALV